MTLLAECVAEAVGTGIIVLLGVGSVCCAVLTGALQGLLQVALVWAIAVCLAIFATARVSGAHLNPAVSLALAVWRPGSFPRKKLVPFVVAQLVGAMVAGAVNLLVFGELLRRFDAKRGCARGEPCSVFSAMVFGEYAPNPGAFPEAWQGDGPDFAGPWVCFLVEAWGTSILMFMILSLTDPRNQVPAAAGPPLIGLTVAALIAVYAPITQAGWNPARDFGPRLVAWLAGYGRVALPGPRGDFWAYILGPCAGSLVAVPFYDLTVGAGLATVSAQEAEKEPVEQIACVVDTDGKCVVDRDGLRRRVEAARA